MAHRSRLAGFIIDCQGVCVVRPKGRLTRANANRWD